jgi:uncharacterized protein YjiS (DUF1127 family)
MNAEPQSISCAPAAPPPALPGARIFAAVLRLANTLGDWHDRAHQRRQLLSLDSRMLKDIGITGSEARQEGEKAFWRP